jgi:ferredoxin
VARESVKIYLDKSICVGHGRCYELAETIFTDDERGHAVLTSETVPPLHEVAARKAEGNCPERAIRIEEG